MQFRNPHLRTANLAAPAVLVALLMLSPQAMAHHVTQGERKMIERVEEGDGEFTWCTMEISGTCIAAQSGEATITELMWMSNYVRTCDPSGRDNSNWADMNADFKLLAAGVVVKGSAANEATGSGANIISGGPATFSVDGESYEGWFSVSEFGDIDDPTDTEVTRDAGVDFTLSITGELTGEKAVEALQEAVSPQEEDASLVGASFEFSGSGSASVMHFKSKEQSCNEVAIGDCSDLLDEELCTRIPE